MTEMKWVRIAPGHYATRESYNGYSYRISQYKPGWPYSLQYRWDNDSTGTWRQPNDYSSSTIAGCKRSAAKHNANPRRKWVFVGRQDNGQLAFVPADQNPDSNFKQTALIDPQN